MALEKILVVGRQPKTQQVARPFTKKLYAADEVADIWELLKAADPNLIVFDADIPDPKSLTPSEPCRINPWFFQY